MGVDVLTLRSMYPPSRPEPAPLQRLAVGVIHQALDDLVAPQPLVRRDAQRFFQSEAFDVWCGLTPLHPAAVRHRLLILRLTDDRQA